ncbi:MAG TPA: FAD-dependent monooxygenase [Streptosporangiaceae bacterium]|jgi:2-polyprenyl-6-methoxyphenol hydroxylase-like FAD-dependent oxidoreductase|nr:FAD-dependent monooxygenase [Streptosporangiaceae bacterium]
MMAERGIRVVVAGGGVAGASCAIALARIGAEVTVYEAYREPAGPAGSFVSLAVNGLRALDVLGVLAPVQAAGLDVERHRMWSGRGKLLGDVPRGRRSGDSLHSVTLMRGDLVSILRDEAARSGVRIVAGRRLGRDFLGQARPDGADLVVGADGIWSETRRALDPGAPEPAYAGLYSVSGISGEVPGVSRHAREHPGGPGPAEPSSWNMIFGRRGAFIYLPAPDGRIWWSAQVSAPRPPADLVAVTAADLTALFRAEERAVAILDAAQQIHTASVHHVLAPVPRRHGQSTVLVGDAAHPAGAGQGASMALEDAVALANQLRHAAAIETYVSNGIVESNVSSALAAFDERRRGRAGKLAKTAASSNEAKTAGPVAARLRDMIMPVMVPRFYEQATAWLYDYDPGQLPARRTTTGAA